MNALFDLGYFKKGDEKGRVFYDKLLYAGEFGLDISSVFYEEISSYLLNPHAKDNSWFFKQVDDYYMLFEFMRTYGESIRK